MTLYGIHSTDINDHGVGCGPLSSEIVLGFTDIVRWQALPKVGEWESEVSYSFGKLILDIENC